MKTFTRAAFALLLITLITVTSSGCNPFWSGDRNWPFFGFFWFPFGLISLALYFLPIIVAIARRKRDVLGIVLLNVLAGWTFIGWIIALIWAFLPDR